MTHKQLFAPPAADKPKVLLIDDEPDFLFALKSYFSMKGFTVYYEKSAEAGLRTLAAKAPDAVITDMALPGMNGLELLKEIRQKDSHLPVIIMTGVGTIESAVEAMQFGAFHYIAKPLDIAELVHLSRHAIANGQLLRDEKSMEPTFADSMIMGNNQEMKTILQAIVKVAPSMAPTILQGETGTGKSRIARFMHSQSDRSSGPFFTIDCGALSEGVLESELFGHVRGAFTGAISAKRGLLEEAQGGTVFLDEIGELNPSTQVKLLRAVQEKEIRAVGGNSPVHIDVRFISATSRDLDQSIAAGKFREDLYYRLAVISLRLPPLRERREDILLFTDHFIRKFNARHGKNVLGIGPGVMQSLLQQEWKGNIRELENTLERAVILAEGDTITLDGLGLRSLASERRTARPHSLKNILEESEKMAIIEALEACRGNRTRAAESLGISRRALYNKIIAHGL